MFPKTQCTKYLHSNIRTCRKHKSITCSDIMQVQWYEWKIYSDGGCTESTDLPEKLRETSMVVRMAPWKQSKEEKLFTLKRLNRWHNHPRNQTEKIEKEEMERDRESEGDGERRKKESQAAKFDTFYSGEIIYNWSWYRAIKRCWFALRLWCLRPAETYIRFTLLNWDAAVSKPQQRLCTYWTLTQLWQH